MPRIRKPSPRPVKEHLKAERIQELLRALPEWRLSGAQIAAGALTLTFTTAKTARALTKEELELATALEKVA